MTAISTTQQTAPVGRTQRTTVVWKLPRVLTEMIWNVWQHKGAYNGTGNGPATGFEPALRIALYATDAWREIKPAMTVDRKTVRFSISTNLLDELTRRATEAGLDVVRYAERLLVEIAPVLMAAAARNKLTRELEAQGDERPRSAILTGTQVTIRSENKRDAKSTGMQDAEM